MKLDLHGVKHSDVQKLVDSYIWKSINSKTDELEIITGNSSKMKQLVIKVLNEYQYEYQVGNPWNSGFIRVFII